MRKSMWSILMFLILGYLFVVFLPVKLPIVALQLAMADPPKSLPVPVDGVRPAAIRNSWGAPRDRGRHHQAAAESRSRRGPVRRHGS